MELLVALSLAVVFWTMTVFFINPTMPDQKGSPFTYLYPQSPIYITWFPFSVFFSIVHFILFSLSLKSLRKSGIGFELLLIVVRHIPFVLYCVSSLLYTNNVAAQKRLYGYMYLVIMGCYFGLYSLISLHSILRTDPAT